VATSTDERAKVELSVAATARNSRLLIEDTHLPFTDVEISCEAGGWTTMKAEFVPKRPDFETVIEGELYNEESKAIYGLRLIFGADFTKCSLQIDGEDRYCRAASVWVSPKDGQTHVTLEEVSAVQADGTTSKVPEITGYLIAD
jgi:hypothetical protein